jgi:hypothetical protein
VNKVLQQTDNIFVLLACYYKLSAEGIGGIDAPKQVQSLHFSFLFIH